MNPPAGHKTATPAFWVVVPAAGVGRRMGAALPKQYLALAGRRVIEHTLARLAAHPLIRGVVVALADGDDHWEGLSLDLPVPLVRVTGGEERCHSVLNALDHLTVKGDGQDWVLVHDAARPCLRPEDLDRLITELAEDPVGGVLGVPVRDTMKRAGSDGRIRETVDRNGLWHAQTPQMFRLDPLRDALRSALDAGVAVTDEAQAMERAGFSPRLVEGHADNIKITRPEDLALAEFFLARQERAEAGS